MKTLVSSMAVLLMAFVIFGLVTWVRVLQVIPYSSSCATTLVQISRQSAAVRPFFLAAFIISVFVFESSRRKLPRSWRYGFLVTLGLAAGLIIIPWLVSVIYA
jgi:hypothetical protein